MASKLHQEKFSFSWVASEPRVWQVWSLDHNNPHLLSSWLPSSPQEVAGRDYLFLILWHRQGEAEQSASRDCLIENPNLSPSAFLLVSRGLWRMGPHLWWNHQCVCHVPQKPCFPVEMTVAAVTLLIQNLLYGLFYVIVHFTGRRLTFKVTWLKHTGFVQTNITFLSSIKNISSVFPDLMW